MVRILTAVSAAVMAATPLLALDIKAVPERVHAQTHGQLFLTYPNKSTVWHKSAKVYFNWLNAPSDTLEIKLVAVKGSTISEAYTVSTHADARFGNAQGACDRQGTNDPCGHLYWEVPYSIQPGRYQAVVTVNGSGQTSTSAVFSIED